MMAKNDEIDKKKSLLSVDFDEDAQGSEGTEGTEGEAGSGALGGEIHFRFRDAASTPPRDDVLPPSELKRLLGVQADLHKAYVDKQKQTRKERLALKEGKKNLVSANQQLLGKHGFDGGSRFKQHPIANKAQFSGVDKQVIGLPSEFSAETNLELQEKLENRFQHRFTPQFHPKPRPAG